MATATTERPTTRATVRYIGRSAYKVRHVVGLIRGKDAEEAQNILMLCERGAAEEVGKLLNSAIANAEHNQQIPGEELRVKEAFVDEGPTAKRFRPRARGRGNRILKRSCHITIVLERMDPDEIATKSAKDSNSGAANAREQRRRRAEASKAAAKAKQEALDAETDESALLEGDEEEVVSDKPKKAKKVADVAEAEEKPKAKKAPAKKAKVVEADADSSESASESGNDEDVASAPKAKKTTKKDSKEEGDA